MYTSPGVSRGLLFFAAPTSQGTVPGTRVPDKRSAPWGVLLNQPGTSD